MNNSIASKPARPLSLQHFVNNLPKGASSTLSEGRFVFGSRIQDTLPYLVEPGAEAAVKPDDVINMPITRQAFAYTFDLSDPKQRESYQTVMNAIAAGWYKPVFVHRQWDTEKKDMIIYIEVWEQHRVIKADNPYDKLMSEALGVKKRPIS